MIDGKHFFNLHVKVTLEEKNGKVSIDNNDT